MPSYGKILAAIFILFSTGLLIIFILGYVIKGKKAQPVKPYNYNYILAL